MTTREFIARNLGVSLGHRRWCSSVLADQDGIVYSYGQHYPLARIINGKVFVNNAGYSVTTAKHINWAFQAGRDRGLPTYGVPLENGQSLDLRGIKASLSNALKAITAQMRAKKRKNTQVYKHLQWQRMDLSTALRAING